MPKRTNTTPVQSGPKRSTQSELVGENISRATKSDTSESQHAVAGVADRDKPKSRIEPSRSRTTSYSSTSSARSNYEEGLLFGGVKHGQRRNILEIDVLRIDGEPCTTNLPEKEIYNRLLRGQLKLKQSIINSMQTQWRGHPYVQVRLKQDIDISSVAGPGQFIMVGVDKDGSEVDVLVDYEVRGSPNPNYARARREEGPNDPWTRYVKIEGTGFDLDKLDLTKWLALYGQTISDFTETLLKFEDELAENDEDEEVQIGTGRFSVKMIIDTHIPQYIPAYGRKIKIHYRGIEKQCTNCYENGHYRAHCESRTRSWIEYVSDFIDPNPEIDLSYFGTWTTRVADWKARQNKDTDIRRTASIENLTAELNSAEISQSLSNDMFESGAPTSADPTASTTRTKRSRRGNQSKK